MDVIRAYPFGSGPPVPASTVALWWADDLAVADGGNVTSWTDRVGGHVLTNPSTAPVMRTTGGANSKPTVEFNGTSSYLEKGAADAISTASQGVVIAVVSITTPTAGAAVWSSADTAVNNRYIYGATRYQTVGEIDVQQTNSGGSDAVRGSTGVTAGTPSLLEWSSSGSAYNFRLNNATQTSTTYVGSNTGDWFGDTTGRDNFTLGAVHYPSVVGFNAMKLSMLLVADAELSAGDRTEFNAFIASHYGLTLS